MFQVAAFSACGRVMTAWMFPRSPGSTAAVGTGMRPGSGVRGWNASETHYAVADSPLGPYGAKKQMSEQNTWNSQIRDFVYVAESDLVFAMCDAWWIPDKQDLNASRYLWLPIDFDPETNTAKMLYQENWTPFNFKPF